MYFEIDNTPENIKKARNRQIRKSSPKEECPRLIIAPFSRAPQVVFENVLIGSTCERHLEIFNPVKQVQQIRIGRALPPGLLIDIPDGYMLLEPETCYTLTLLWTPLQPTALRETIRFINDDRGRYDVVVVLKSAMNVKGKRKGFKTSPGKISKKPTKTKKSPVAIYKKKAEVIYNQSVNLQKITNAVESKMIVTRSNKENVPIDVDSPTNYRLDKCPFQSPVNIDLNLFEIFSNVRKPSTVLQETYDKSFEMVENGQSPVSQNILKPSNRLTFDTSPATSLFDDISFTPLKTKKELEKGPKIVISMNSESELDDSLDIKIANKENNATHSIFYVTSLQQHKSVGNQYVDYCNQISESPTIQHKKIPNTSSPTDLNSPNFSINTELSRISDLSFLPQRFSTEKKVTKAINETSDLIDDINFNKFHSDTYTKESPNTSTEKFVNYMRVDTKVPHYFMRDHQPKMCKQSLFREYQQQREHYDKNNTNRIKEYQVWSNEVKVDPRSPPRSTSPPLQSIPEESSHIFDSTNEKLMSTFTMNRTFDKPHNKSYNRQSWSKKTVRPETEIWKIPLSQPKKSLKSRPSTVKPNNSLCNKVSDSTIDSADHIKNISLNYVGNVYSQSLTVDPFLSSTYFYDEEAVDKFEKEFKRWLNCILTPPADLDSNIEQKIDFGKTWIENRNKEVPAAPTKEQVCNIYHNNHRLESLRRSARALFLSPEIVKVLQKLNVQIDKKLIMIRPDRNLHLDVGLQKVILEILLSYNPLWLRIGLEAIYGFVLPLKSNSDIDGLTLFVVQRLFRNPYLKNKHSKSSAPNMLLPAYMEAIKKFTLKKFFSLVFFLDQAKQRKLIGHDPCLFCRNAVCKESREIIIRFTRELIAGIGDITRHLRPLGYIVIHKQLYLDEYKYAVHNIAVDIRDGVRLTKVMEIILMKNGLLNQLRAPAISRLQKIHNVQVALNALKETNFVIIGDITANDIADGHREKTLSLLWQIIHVFRAPLFVKAANVIQTWWRKKYEVIIEKRMKEERERQRLNNAASVIQCWWRRIQYNRFVEWKMQQVTHATIILQKYCRKWICQTRFRTIKSSVLQIEMWYISIKMVKKAKEFLQKLKLEREALLQKSAIVIQSHVRKWFCLRHYKHTLKKITLIQSIIRTCLAKKSYLKIKQSVIFIQQKYRSRLIMKQEILRFAKKRNSAIIIQRNFRMIKEYKRLQIIKNAVSIIEEHYLALLKKRVEQSRYLKLKRSAIIIQTRYRSNKARTDYIRDRTHIVKLQRRIRASLFMKRERSQYLQIKKSIITLQKYVRATLKMKQTRQGYLKKRQSAILIQSYFRFYLLSKYQRNSYIQLKKAVIKIQEWHKSILAMRKDRTTYLNLKKSVLIIQNRHRANILMKCTRFNYQEMRSASIVLQQKYKAQKEMHKMRDIYLKLKSSTTKIQRAYRAYILRKQQRYEYLKLKTAAITIQRWYRNCKIGNQMKIHFQKRKQACISLQRFYRGYIIGKEQRQEYLRIRSATIKIQKCYSAFIKKKIVREEYLKLKSAIITIQTFYRSYLVMKKQKSKYLQLKGATLIIQNYYRNYKESLKIRQNYYELKRVTLYVQRRYRSKCNMLQERTKFLNIKKAVLLIQNTYKGLLMMRKDRLAYLQLKSATIKIQKRYKALSLMKQERKEYTTIHKACVVIQRFYRDYRLGRSLRDKYLALRQSAVSVQTRYRALLEMRKERNSYLNFREAVITIQRQYRAYCSMSKERSKYLFIRKACITIQRRYRAYVIGKKQKTEYITLKSAAILIQNQYRTLVKTRNLVNQYQLLRNTVIFVQRRVRANTISRDNRRNEAANRIQIWYRSVIKFKQCRNEYLKIKQCVLCIQSTYRMFRTRKQYLHKIKGILTIQRLFRAYKIGKNTREEYKQLRKSVLKLQAYIRCFINRQRYLRTRSAILTIQKAYRLKKLTDEMKKIREKSAICIQKYVRRYLVQSRYTKYHNKVVFIQKKWRSKLVTRLLRCEFLQKRRYMIQLQALIRGYLVRKQVQIRRETLEKTREEQRKNYAASKIQALFRGHKARLTTACDKRVTELRRRWREGALNSTQESLKERHEEAMEVLHNIRGIETVIRAFRSLELLTELFPMSYDEDAPSIVRRVYVYMSATNRSISSIEVLKSAAAVLVNLTRHRGTGPKIYSRDLIPSILKFMWRFSNSEPHLFCVMCTYLWLFAKYDQVRKDLKEFLHLPENHKMMVAIKNNVSRIKRMTENAVKNKHTTQQSSKLNMSRSIVHPCELLPALEPDYGIVRADRPRYFEDSERAINCLFVTYNL